MRIDLDKSITEYKYIPTSIWDTKCFACGTNNPEGLHMTFYTDEKSIFSEIILTETKRGWDQVVHGGILSTILDEIMAWTAIYFTRKIMLTKTLSLNYIHPVHINSKIKAVGWIEEITPKEIVLKAEIYNDKKQLCTEGTGIYALFSAKLAKRLKLLNEDSLDKFEEFLKACESVDP